MPKTDSPETFGLPPCPQCGAAAKDGIDLDPLLIVPCPCGHRYMIEILRPDNPAPASQPVANGPRKRKPQPWRKKSVA